MAPRDGDAVGRSGCPGGWYRIKPRGFVCVGPEATIDPEHPVLRAARRVRPDRKSAMPYRYGFVRAVLPLYLRPPSRVQQERSEMSLKSHLERWRAQQAELNKVVLGADDVPVDARGAPIVGKALGDVPHPTTTWGQGQLFGGDSDDDPVPFWLEGGKRAIPNVADFKVTGTSVFADRARRHTGLAFIGSFHMGEDGFSRRFGITTDLRLAPTSKVKPDTGSPWHGLELGEGKTAPPLPFAWVRVTGVKTYKLSDGKARERAPVEKRSVLLLTGKKVAGPDDHYWELKNGQYVRASQVAAVMPPPEWPGAAKKGEKWIDVSIENQTLTLYVGQSPVFATMVSTGRDKLGDPKTTHSTVRGAFRIQSKHVTATMDSNEGLGGQKAKDQDPAYGVTKRRGEGQFWLRDVPYVQYFEKGYALHVAYWHDVFGLARSHGCINLAPLDGKYVFEWTDGQPPPGWHGVMLGAEMGQGTTIVVRE
ncbi:MAG: L,D-transpeptidase [Polyangiaceae bacterium]|nr:L,D-transpeptidase [Polyangiaceae bacterium]